MMYCAQLNLTPQDLAVVLPTKNHHKIWYYQQRITTKSGITNRESPQNLVLLTENHHRIWYDQQRMKISANVKIVGRVLEMIDKE